MQPTVFVREPDPLINRIFDRKDRFFFSLISTIGIGAIIFTAWPIVSWQLSTLPKLTTKIEAAPIPQGQVLSAQEILSSNVQVIENPDGFSFFSTDYKPSDSAQDGQGKKPKEFKLTIPKLKIKEATVKVNSLDFFRSLSHFPGSALPGEAGNSFITGHSVLPQFNNPADYHAIFTRLSELEIGDDIYAQVNGQTYHYAVLYSKIVNPHDLSVLAPISSTGRNLTLMTCVPPGASLKRLVVITSLI